MGKEIYFHKEKVECDFVLRDGYDISRVIQVSVSLNDPKTKKREINGLIEAMQAYKLDRGLIITEDEYGTETVISEQKSYEIEIIPCWRWLLTADQNRK